MRKTNILYLSFTGMGEALGKSQVLEYLYGLSADNDIHLISYEKEKDLGNVDTLRAEIESNNIKWTYLVYSNKYGAISTIFLILRGIIKSLSIVKSNDIEILHARSMIPALIAYPAKFIYGSKLLFDIRSFSTDEKVDRDRIKKDSFLYNRLMYLEIFLYKNSDFIVTLTNKAKEFLHQKYCIPNAIIEVISTCANSDLFFPNEEAMQLKNELGLSKDNKVLLHSGSVTGWYLFEEEVVFYKELKARVPNLIFLILNEHAHEFINDIMKKNDITEKDYKLFSVSFSEMNQYISISDAAIFFIKPNFSKSASAPTKFAEYVSARLPSIANKGIGDMEEYMEKYNVGHILDVKKITSSDIDEAVKVLTSEINTEDYKKLFTKYLDKNKAINDYSDIYAQLTSQETNQS